MVSVIDELCFVIIIDVFPHIIALYVVFVIDGTILSKCI